MGKRKKRPGDWWAHLLADIAVRLLYALVVSGGLLFMMMGGGSRHGGGETRVRGSTLQSTEFWLFIIAMGVLAAVIGPSLYRYASRRGRGSLQAVKRRSKRR